MNPLWQMFDYMSRFIFVIRYYKRSVAEFKCPLVRMAYNIASISVNLSILYHVHIQKSTSFSLQTRVLCIKWQKKKVWFIHDTNSAYYILIKKRELANHRMRISYILRTEKDGKLIVFTDYLRSSYLFPWTSNKIGIN